MSQPTAQPAPTSAPLPAPGTVPPLPRDKPAPLTLKLSTAQPLPDAMQKAQAALPVLPPSVQAQVSRFWSALQAAQGAYDTLAKGYVSIWESVQYPLEFRQQKASEFMDAVFAKQRADLNIAAGALQAALDTVKAGMLPPLLGTPDVHELKLLNARTDAVLSLEGLQSRPTEQLEVLKDLFQEAKDTQQVGGAGMAYLLAATPFYKRVLRDGVARLGFEEKQMDMLKAIYPAAEPFINALPHVEKLQEVLDLAETVRGFAAMDNGIKLTESLITATPTNPAPTAPVVPVSQGV